MKRKPSSSDTATHIKAAVRHHQGGPPSDWQPEPVPEARGLKAAWLRFWFVPRDAAGLHVIRVFSGLLFTFWLLCFAANYIDFFGVSGWFGLEAFKEAGRIPGGVPAPFGWSILYLAGTNTTLLSAMYWCSVIVVALFTLGIATRITSVLTWVVVVSFVANPAVSYDADFLIVILAFYLMIGYVLLGQWSRSLTLAELIFGPAEGGVLALLSKRREAIPSYAANLAVRLFQVHFALVAVSAGLHKLQFGDWWAGAALWYPLHPPLQTTRDSIRMSPGMWQVEMFVLGLANYAVLAWLIGFPLFAWRQKWRLVLLGGGLAAWVGSVLIYGLPLFGPVFLIASLSYLTPEEWRQGLEWFSNRGQALLGWLRPAPASAGKSTKVGT